MKEVLTFSVGQGGTRLVFSDEPYIPEDSAERLHVFDANTSALFPALPEGSVVLEPGEGSKAWEGAGRILSAALSRGMARDSLFVGVGGGMICDLTAFAASIYMRGARLELVPTSLLAMVDASFGGKTAINFQGYKNTVGTFFPAEKVMLSVGFLDRLPEREFRSGLAEVVKSAMLGDSELFDLLEEGSRSSSLPAFRDGSFLFELVKRSLLVKARFAVDDPTENGIRSHLNLGHTFGHGLEAATGFARFTHGEAVAWGMFRALEAGLDLGETDAAYAERARRLLLSCGYAERIGSVRAEDILAAMGRDKKKRGGRVRFVLQRTLGDSFTTILEDDFVGRIVSAGLA